MQLRSDVHASKLELALIALPGSRRVDRAWLLLLVSGVVALSRA
jgi:hypothetical protein